MVNMTASGTIYTLNIVFLIQALVTGLVLLKFANTIADLVAFYGLGSGQSLVLRNKRAEKVSKKSEFAETGLKAALASFQFGYFDRDHNGTIETVDIVRAFANIEGADGDPAVTADEAHAIATAIMEDADTEGGGGRKVSPSGQKSLDFSEYMTCLDGDAIAFKGFLKNVPNKNYLEDYTACVDAYEAQRLVAEAAKVARTAAAVVTA